MDKLTEDVNFKPLTGDGKGIVEITNIGFEPLLTDEEFRLNKEMYNMKNEKYKLEFRNNIIDNFIFKSQFGGNNSNYVKWLSDFKDANSLKINELNKNIIEIKNKFVDMLKENIVLTRTLHSNREFNNQDQYRNIAIFESSLTRAFECEDRKYSDTIVNVVTYYTQIFKSIIDNGFLFNGNKYVFFTAGSGQTRCKKSTFVRQDYLIKNYNKLFCGLTEKTINLNGGMNTNKFLAYTSLCQTNSEIWKSFDIDRAIVVDDIEFELKNQKVRYIYTESKEDKKAIEELQEKLKILDVDIKNLSLVSKSYTLKMKELDKENDKEIISQLRKERRELNSNIKELRNEKSDLKNKIKEIVSKFYKMEEKTMNIPIPFTDGFGIILSQEETSMVRLPFIKGLMSYAPYQSFKSKYRLKSCKIKDIYGKEYDIEKDNINYIFTKSQFKMWKYYNSWDEYKDCFKKYECEACRCNVETHVKLNAKTNYQILQTLTTEMTDEDIKSLANDDLYDLEHIGDDYKSMLNILGANDKNNQLTPFQKALIKYPEMLKDYYVKDVLSSTKDSMIKKMRSGKFNVNGAYTFIIPDVLACMQWWFLGKRNIDKLGCLGKDEVSCFLFKHDEELDCLRSPHLDHAHCIRNNNTGKSVKKWFKTKGLYVGVKDIMSKLLQYDNDGDKSLVHNNSAIIRCAKQFQSKYGMIPNYYDMQKADPQEINKENLFDGMVLAYHHGNIGTPSNDITGIFSKLNLKSKKEEVQKAIECVAIKTAIVNYTIDYAKTLWKPTLPKNISEQLSQYGTKKVPFFFQFAKDKKKKQCEAIREGCIDRIYNIIPNNRISFKGILGKYSYKNLMSYDVDVKTEEAQKIVELYLDIHKTKKIRYNQDEDFAHESNDEKKNAKLQYLLNAHKIREEIKSKTGDDEEYIVNVLVKALNKDISKSTLWQCYGERILENIEMNIPKNSKLCEVCGERFVHRVGVGKPEIYCEKCKREKELEKYSKYNKKRNT